MLLIAQNIYPFVHSKNVYWTCVCWEVCCKLDKWNSGLFRYVAVMEFTVYWEIEWNLFSHKEQRCFTNILKTINLFWSNLEQFVLCSFCKIHSSIQGFGANVFPYVIHMWNQTLLREPGQCEPEEEFGRIWTSSRFMWVKFILPYL